MLQVLLNALMDPRIRLGPHSSSDRSWVFGCFDYASGKVRLRSRSRLIAIDISC